MKIVVSVPGKVILMGEHASVYGHPALVAAIDRRTRLELTTQPRRQGNGAGLRLLLPELSVDDRRPWTHYGSYAQEKRTAWDAWASGGVRFEQVLGDDPAHLIRVAVGETLLHLNTRPDVEARLLLTSDIPLGSGFGSSAAAAVAVVRALTQLLGAAAGKGQLHRISSAAECRQHGSPSGIDNATVIRGGFLWVEHSGTRLSMTRISPGNRALIEGLRFYHTGTPSESTGEVVEAVRARRAEDPESFDKALNQASARTRALRALIESPVSEPEAHVGCIRRYSAWLKYLGVVPNSISDLTRRVESLGGAAKVSGAGSIRGPGAGSLMVFHPEPDEPAIPSALHPLKPMQASLGVSGARLEALH